jgi:hypothetical protein
MRRKTVGIAASVIGAAFIVFAAASCDDSTGPATPRYVANLNAAAEGGTFTSNGSGVVEFLDQGSEITWTMTLTNMTGVTQSHIHLGDATRVGTTAGPVIINLFIPNGATATLNGQVAHGSITNANNANVSLDSLRVLFNNGNSYANVHTSAHPAGEIRDQIHAAP